MNLPDLKKSIDNKEILPLYIFTGEEIAVMDIYIKWIANLFDGKYKSADSLSSIIAGLKTNSLIDKSKSLYVIRDDKTVSNTESIWEPLLSGTVQRGNSIILVYNSIDKRSKFYKEMSKVITNFEPLSDNILLRYIAKEVTLSNDRALYLIQICKNNYNKLKLEMDKIKNLSNHLYIDNNKAFDMCVDGNAFYIPPDGDIFELLNAILARDINSTYKHFEKFKQRGESPLAILSLLHTNLKALLQIQCAEGLNNIGTVTGLNGFQINNLSKFKGKYTNTELIRMIRIVNYCDKCAKQTGNIEMDMLLDFIFVKIF